ncbi:MAG: redoxin domain-containing protein [Actinomycetia bacterium]|nr:redoxin domain-containing protein [Actinomycetes bacterium]MCP4961286.1 redoxin domain-containing protein [Actinomycetes bacterium]
MRERFADLGSDTDVVLITFTKPERLSAYRDMNDLPFTMLIDKHRRTYHSYGLARGSFRDVWGWKAAKRYCEIIRQDGLRNLRRPEEDTRQLGGDFAVGPDGVLVYGFWGEGPHDRPSVDDLVEVVEGTR